VDSVTDKIRKPVDGYGKLGQRISPALIQALHPGGNGLGADEKRLRCLFQRPTAGGPEFQDRQTFGGTVEGTLVGRNAGHAGVLDTQLLAKQCIVFLVLVPFGSQADLPFRAVGRPTASIDSSILGE
jgi:hypothetical protein